MSKYIDAKGLLDFGYIQEANRLFFHPLGLALGVQMPEGTIRVLDARDDPEGFVFESLDNPDSLMKARKVAAEFARRGSRRLELLGYVTQPVPGAEVVSKPGEPPP